MNIITVTLNPTIDRVIEVPRLAIGEHLKGRLRSRVPAGKAINVSRALALLGVRSTAVGWVGHETLSEFVRTAAHSGFDAHFTPISGSSRENITLIDPITATETHIRDAGPTIDAADIERLRRDMLPRVNRETAVVFTGSLPPGMEPSAFARLVDDCIASNARVVVDSSGPALAAVAQRPLWLLKPNLAELEELLGRPMREEDAILAGARQLQQHAALVLVTMGQAGVYGISRDAGLHARVSLAPPQIRSTVGCGDAMLAGFLSVLCGPSADLGTALRRGAAAGAASAMSELPGVFNPADISHLAARAEVRVL